MNIQYLDRYFHYDKDLVTENPVFLEIGNYSGGNMKRLLRAFPGARVVIYEAGLESFEKLKAVYEKIGSPNNVSIHNKAVSDSNGKVTFYEYVDKPSSNSVFERHIKKKNLILDTKHIINSVNLEGVMQENDIDKIDVVFANAEGVEIMLLNEVFTNHNIRNRIPQLCLSLHERIVGKEIMEERLNNVSDFYSFEQGEGVRGATKKYVSHLFRRKDLLKI